MEQLSFFESHKEEHLLEQVEQDLIRRGLYVIKEPDPQSFVTGVFVSDECSFMEIQGALPILDLRKKDAYSTFFAKLHATIADTDYEKKKDEFITSYENFKNGLNEIKEVEKKIRLLETQKNNAKKQNEWLKEENNEYKERMLELEKRLRQLKSNKCEKQEKIRELKKQLLSYEKEQQPLLAKSLEAKDRKEEITMRLHKLSIDATLSNRLFHPSKYQEMSDEMQEYTNRYDELSDIENEVNEKLSALRDKIIHVQTELKDTEMFVLTLDSQIDETQRNYDNVSESYKKGVKHVEKGKKRISVTEKRMREAHYDLQRVEDDSIVMRKECARKASELLLADFKDNMENKIFMSKKELSLQDLQIYSRYIIVHDLEDVDKGYCYVFEKGKVSKDHRAKFITIQKLED